MLYEVPSYKLIQVMKRAGERAANPPVPAKAGLLQRLINYLRRNP